MHDPTHQDKARSINRFRAAEFQAAYDAISWYDKISRSR